MYTGCRVPQREEPHEVEKEISCKLGCDLSPVSPGPRSMKSYTLENGDGTVLPGVPSLLPHTGHGSEKPGFQRLEVCPNAALMLTSQMTSDEFCDLARPPSGSYL